MTDGPGTYSRTSTGGQRAVPQVGSDTRELLALIEAFTEERKAARREDAARLEELRRQVAASSTTTARVEAIAEEISTRTSHATSAARQLTRATIVGSGGISAILAIIFAAALRFLNAQWDASEARDAASEARATAIEQRSIDNQRSIEAERAERLRVEEQLEAMRSDLDKIAKAIATLSTPPQPDRRRK